MVSVKPTTHVPLLPKLQRAYHIMKTTSALLCLKPELRKEMDYRFRQLLQREMQRFLLARQEDLQPGLSPDFIRQTNRISLKMLYKL